MNVETCRAALDVLSRLKTAAEAWDGKMNYWDFIAALKEVAKNYTAAEVYVYEKTITYDGIDVFISGDPHTKIEGILFLCREDFTTTEKGKFPRINAAMFSERVAEKEKYLSAYIQSHRSIETF